MSDALDRAVDARVAAYSPDKFPPFDVLVARKRRRDRRRLALGGAGLVALVLAGAAVAAPGAPQDRVTVGDPATSSPAADVARAPAVWEIDAADPPQAADQFLSVLVARLGCSSGETGEVLPPQVEESAQSVVVTFAVAPLPDGDYLCPGNKAVPLQVRLSAPLGDRTLIDGACLGPPAGTTSFCLDKIRWPLSGTTTTPAPSASAPPSPQPVPQQPFPASPQPAPPPSEQPASLTTCGAGPQTTNGPVELALRFPAAVDESTREGVGVLTNRSDEAVRVEDRDYLPATALVDGRIVGQEGMTADIRPLVTLQPGESRQFRVGFPITHCASGERLPSGSYAAVVRVLLQDGRGYVVSNAAAVRLKK